MSDLRLRQRRAWWGGTQTEVIDVAPDTLAVVAYTVIAATLAEPLRRALDRHLAGHGCGSRPPGFGYCPEATRLWDLLPDGDRILIA